MALNVMMAQRFPFEACYNIFGKNSSPWSRCTVGLHFHGRNLILDTVMDCDWTVDGVDVKKVFLVWQQAKQVAMIIFAEISMNHLGYDFTRSGPNSSLLKVSWVTCGKLSMQSPSLLWTVAIRLPRTSSYGCAEVFATYKITCSSVASTR